MTVGKSEHSRREKNRILLAVTADQSLKLMYGFPEHLASKGWDVHVVSGGQSETVPTQFLGYSPSVTFHRIPMTREPALAPDCVALLRWLRLMNRLRPDVVCIGTPKSSLLGLAAARITRVPVRIYLLRGLRLESESGFRRTLLKQIERATASLANSTVSVSPSLQRLAESYGIARHRKILTIGHGSSNGIEIPEQYNSTNDADRDRLLQSLELDPAIPVVGYVGRMTPAKGVADLISAVDVIQRDGVKCQLLLVGGEDSHGYVSGLIARLEEYAIPFAMTGYVRSPAEYYAAMDLFVLPSYREGMPNVTLESSAYGIPVVTTDATGCVDSVLDGETGLIYPVGDYMALARALHDLLTQWPQRGRELGRRGARWVAEVFSREQVWKSYETYFWDELTSRRKK